MKDYKENNFHGTQEMPEAIEQTTPIINIGLLANYPDSSETRMLLTPEACGLLVAGGVAIAMESGAGSDISFTDAQYAEYGVTIVSRDEALKYPVVLSYSSLKAKDINKMIPGSAILCMMTNAIIDTEAINALLANRISMGCFDNMLSHNDEPVFANVIDEIDGRASIIYAQDALSFEGGGKGVLLGGVTGINPCEVLLIGMGHDIVSAAKSAVALGARVAIMDNDVSALQIARDMVGGLVDMIAIHPRVLYNRAKSADVIILGTTSMPFDIPRNLFAAMKENVYLLDLKECHPSVAVPRTVAMGLSNALVNFFNEMALKGGFSNMVATTSGMQYGMVTYDGYLVDKLLGSYLGMQSADIGMLLSPVN